MIGGELEGEDIVIQSIASLRSATAGDLSFVANAKLAAAASDTSASALIVGHFDVPFNGPIVRVQNPYLGYAKATHLFVAPPSALGIHKAAVISEHATLGQDVSVAANAVIDAHATIGNGAIIGAGAVVGEGVVIGEDTRIDANTVIHKDVAIGNRVRIGSCAVIGGEGFGFAPTGDGWQRICQLGSVIIEDDCDIGPGCTIDRGALDNTHLKQGVILDDQVHIAHNVVIGERTAMAGYCGVAGSTEIGADCTIAGMVGMVGHIKIADKVHITGGTIVTKSITESGSYSSGTPMSDSSTWRKNAARFSGLDKWVRQVKKQLDGLPKT